MPHNSSMIPTKVIITNRDDVLGSVILALATRCAGQQIAGGHTKEALATNGFFRLNFNNQQQVDKFAAYLQKYVPESMQTLLRLEPNSN
jgi:hypothetical protein